MNPGSIAAERTRLSGVYVAEGLASVAANLLTIGIFFFTRDRFGWGLRENLMFSTAMGVVYTLGALSAHPITERFGTTRPMAAAFLACAGLAVLAMLLTTPLVVVIAVLGYVYFSTICWPILECLIATGDISPHEMSRRISIYNVVWSGVSAAIVAVNGLILEHMGNGFFLLASGSCAVAGAISLCGRLSPRPGSSKPAQIAPEPQLKRQRAVAMWLARISMPAMYVVTFALAAMMPSLEVLQPFRPAVQTLTSSIWLIVRWIAFLLLGVTVFWHTRPRLLLGAAALLLVSFLAITRFGLITMIGGQILLGLATGLIYMASLYFGMVLSEGSAESGGHHEAMIGVGMTLGPAAGFAMQWMRPGDQPMAVMGVSSLVALSTFAAAVASLRLGRKTV